MNTTIVNLKQFYQRPAMWVILLIMLPTLIFPTITFSKVDIYFLIAPVPLLLVMGTITAGMYAETMASPMAFCLPGHQRMARKLLLGIGLFLTIVFTIIAFCHAETIIALDTLNCITILALFWLAYLAGVMITFKSRSWGLVFCSFSLFMLLGTDVYHFILNRIPYLVIISAIILLISTWRYLGNAKTARTLCGTTFLGFSSFNARKMEKAKRAYQIKAEAKGKNNLYVAAPVERFFIKRLIATKPGTNDHYYWGGLYKTMAVSISQIKNPWAWITCGSLFIYFGYLHFSTMILFLPTLIAAFGELNIFSNQLICGGRQDRFRTAGMLMMTYLLIALVSTSVLILLTIALENVLPPITIDGRTFTYSAVNNYYALSLVALMTPVGAILNIISKKFKSAKLLMIVVLQSIFITSIMVIKGVTISPQMQIVFYSCGVLCWIIFALYLKKVCSQANLTK